MAKIHKQIVTLLSEKPMTLSEIAETLEYKEKKVFNALKKLFSDGDVDCDAKTRNYHLAKNEA